jgi:hypothetical protein
MRLCTLLVLALAACGTPKAAAPPAEGPRLPPADQLTRSPVTDKAKVKHVLIGWQDLADAYDGNLDPRAEKRTRADADKLAQELLARVRGGEAIEGLMAQYSEDPGSAANGDAYDVTADAAFVPEFKALALRLQIGEAGIAETQFGFHVIKRIE